jgi:hypothetical protein
MDARRAFLVEHAHLHAAATTGSADTSLEDGLCAGLTDAQLRARPGGLNSIVWLLWHITRFEDVVVNAVIRGVPEVLDRGGWPARLDLDSRLIGTGAGDDEVADFSARADPALVRAYRAAVGRETHAWASTADFAALDAVPDVAARLAQAPASITERAAWVQALWTGRTAHGLLLLPVLGHGAIHIGEARVTRARLGAPSR